MPIYCVHDIVAEVVVVAGGVWRLQILYVNLQVNKKKRGGRHIFFPFVLPPDSMGRMWKASQNLVHVPRQINGTKNKDCGLPIEGARLCGAPPVSPFFLSTTKQLLRGFVLWTALWGTVTWKRRLVHWQFSNTVNSDVVVMVIPGSFFWRSVITCNC